MSQDPEDVGSNVAMWIEKVVRRGALEDAGGAYFVQGLDACFVVKTFYVCQ